MILRKWQTIVCIHICQTYLAELPVLLNPLLLFSWISDNTKNIAMVLLTLRFNYIYTVHIFNNILYSNISVMIELVPPLFFIVENNHIYRVWLITWEEAFVEYFPHHLPLGEASHPPVYLYSLCPQIHPVLRLSSVLGLLKQRGKNMFRENQQRIIYKYLNISPDGSIKPFPKVVSIL